MSATTQGHTPGPWEAVNSSIRSNAPTKSGGWGCIVARVSTYLESDAVEDERQEDANARLIAAAPEMLEALRRLTFAAANRDNTMGDPCRLLECKAELEAAGREAQAIISKATNA